MITQIKLWDNGIKGTGEIKKTPHKEILWNCFGDIIVSNIKQNVDKDSIQCEKCGARFIPNASNKKLCNICDTYQPIGDKTINCIECGIEVDVDAKDNKTCRCETCSKIHRNNYQRDLMRRKRNKC